MSILKCSHFILAAVVLTAIPAWPQQPPDLSDKSSAYAEMAWHF